MQPLAKRNYTLLSTFLFFYFMAQGAANSLLSIWYSKALSLSSTEIGLVFSANFIGAMISQPIYGYVSDKLGLRKHLLWIITALCISCGPFFVLVYAPLLQTQLMAGAILGGLYLGITFLAGSYAIESYVDRVGRKYGFEYGRARLFGSLGFASASFVSGHLYNWNPTFNYGLASLAGLLLIPVLLASRIEPSRDERASSDTLRMRDAIAILSLREFWGFMVLILGVTNLYLVYDQQFPRYYASLFPDPNLGRTMFGYLQSAQIFVEAGMLFVAPLIVGRLGPKRALLFAAGIMIVRIAGSGFATGPISISCMKMLHSLELPVLIVAVFKYIAMHFEPRLASTIYMVGFSFGHSLGLAVLSPLAGKAYDLFGFPTTYLLIALFSGLLWIASCLSLARDTQTQPKPVGAAARPAVSSEVLSPP